MNEFVGTVVLPQRGTGEWSNWGFTHAVEVPLQKGSHEISLSFGVANENMYGEINQAMVDYMRLIKIRKKNVLVFLNPEEKDFSK